MTTNMHVNIYVACAVTSQQQVIFNMAAKVYKKIRGKVHVEINVKQQIKMRSKIYKNMRILLGECAKDIQKAARHLVHQEEAPRHAQKTTRSAATTKGLQRSTPECAITNALPNFILRYGATKRGQNTFYSIQRLSRSSASRITHLIIKLIWPFCMAVGKRFRFGCRQGRTENETVAGQREKAIHIDIISKFNSCIHL